MLSLCFLMKSPQQFKTLTEICVNKLKEAKLLRELVA